MKRGIVIYLENKRFLLLQFGCLYTSLKYIQSQDTDLIVCGTKDILSKLPDDCIKIESEPVSYKKEWRNYHFMNSINCLIDENSSVLDDYDFLLRCDADTFITPAWNSFYPDNYTVGGGGYVNDEETRQNLKRIANHFGLRHQGIHNIGSTHYGNGKLVREVCSLIMPVTKYILNDEFKDTEGRWPGWYMGVSLLYGTEIATNHLVDDIRREPSLLDFGSTSMESVQNHPHIHCWHTDNMFSKFWFEAGKYDKLSMDSLDLDKINEYCLYMALKSKKDMPWLGK